GASKERRDLVLDMMAEGKLISKEEAAQAKRKPLLTNKDWKKELAHLDKADKNIVAYRQKTLQELKEFYEIDPTKPGSPRVEVYTGLDPEVQRATNEALLIGLSSAPAHNKGGAIALEAKTGLIVAVGGGKDFTLQGSNEAYQTIRPTGSAIKPLTVFAPALAAQTLN